MFRRKREPEDFKAEIEAHLQLEIARLIEQGLTPEEARASAHRSLGNIGRVQEKFYEASRWAWWDALLRDVRFGLRLLRRSFGLTVVVVVTLALGVGASTALFSIADQQLRKNPDWYRWGAITGWEPQRNLRTFHFSIPEFVELSGLHDIFERTGALYWSNAAITTGDYPERVGCAHLMPTAFSKPSPELGRFFGSDEDRPGGPQVAVLSHEFWQSHFSGDRGIIGRRIRLDGLDYTVIGVTRPRENRWGSSVMVPAQLDLADQDRSRRDLWVLVTLREGVTWQQADARLNALAQNMAHEYRISHPEYVGLQLHFWDGYEAITAGIRPVLFLLLAAVAVLLLIACANIATLLLARAGSRKQEFTMRAALGARPGRIIRQLLTESVLLAMAGGVAGILVAHFCFPLVLHLIPATWLDRSEDVHLNWRVLFAATGITLSAGVLFGLAPAWYFLRTKGGHALTHGSSRIDGDRAGRLTRHVLVVSEIALTLVVLGGAVLMLETYRNLRQIDLGFQPEHVLSLQIALAGTKYTTAEQINEFFRKAIERVKALPGVDGAAVVSGLPMMDRTVDLNTRNFTIEGHPIETGNGLANANFRVASAGYFDVVGARLVRGRVFTDQDGPGKAPVVVINQMMARLYWPNLDPVGARIHLATGPLNAGTAAQGPAITVVGVVSDVKQIRLIDAPVRQEFYLPQAQSGTNELAVAGSGAAMSMMVRSSMDPSALTSAIRRAIQSIDRELPIYDVVPMNTVVSDSFGPKRIATVLLGFFAVVALLLSTIGTYAVMAYSVSQRKREVGLRMALGAQRHSILKLMMRSGIVLALIGLGVGISLTLLLGRLLLHLRSGVTPVGLFYGVSSFIPVTLIAIVALLLLVALAASYIPARRAMRVDPIVTLRYD